MVSQATVTVRQRSRDHSRPVAPPHRADRQVCNFAATFNAAFATLHMTGNFMNGGSVLIYETAAGATDRSGHQHRGHHDRGRHPASFVTTSPRRGIGTYTIEAIENGVVCQATVTVDAVGALARAAARPNRRRHVVRAGAATYTYAAVVPQASGGFGRGRG